MNIPKRYKWFIYHWGFVTYSTSKPKKIRGGFLFHDGYTILGTNVKIWSRLEFSERFRGGIDHLRFLEEE